MNLLQPARNLEHYALLAVDGEVGCIEEVYFDDSTWTIRYLVVNSGDWLTGRRVLISPVVIGDVDEEKKIINVELTRSQIENSPPINADKVVSRQYETEYYQYYNWTPYWALNPLPNSPMAGASREPPPAPGKNGFPNTEKTYLRSTAEINGYTIAAQDGEIGHVDEFIIDTQYWVIRYLQIDTRNWWLGKHILINPGWIEEVSWIEQTVSVGLTREAIKRAPGYEPSKAIRRGDETQLFKHYDRPGYWHQGNG